jgi:hypothetical protein
MSLPCLNRVWELSNQKGAALLRLLALADYATCFPLTKTGLGSFAWPELDTTGKLAGGTSRDAEIIITRVALRRLLQMLHTGTAPGPDPQPLTAQDFTSVIGLTFHGPPLFPPLYPPLYPFYVYFTRARTSRFMQFPYLLQLESASRFTHIPPLFPKTSLPPSSPPIASPAAVHSPLSTFHFPIPDHDRPASWPPPAGCISVWRFSRTTLHCTERPEIVADRLRNRQGLDNDWRL